MALKQGKRLCRMRKIVEAYEIVFEPKEKSLKQGQTSLNQGKNLWSQVYVFTTKGKMFTARGKSLMLGKSSVMHGKVLWKQGKIFQSRGNVFAEWEMSMNVFCYVFWSSEWFISIHIQVEWFISIHIQVEWFKMVGPTRFKRSRCNETICLRLTLTVLAFCPKVLRVHAERGEPADFSFPLASRLARFARESARRPWNENR